MVGTIATWRWVVSGAGRELRRAATEADPARPADVTRLRRLGDVEQVAVSLQLSAAREKAAAKFRDRAAGLVADVEALEQATSLAIGHVKAQRFAQLAPPGPVLDLCSGMGGDAMALRDAGLDVLAIDRDPVRAWMTAQNARCPAAAADVTTLKTPDPLNKGSGVFWHVDPARRTGRGRTWRLADMQPGIDWVASLARRGTGAVKLSPGIDLAELAEQEIPGEIGFISEAGRLVQAVLWTGDLQRAVRSATLVEDGAVHELRGEPAEPAVAPMGRYIHTVDPALERAGLLPMLQLPAVHPKLGLLTSDAPAASPWLTSFEVLHHGPWRRKKVRQWLAERGAGVVEVKTRGKAVDPDREQAALRGGGDTRYTVFVLRWDRAVMATIARRVHGR